MNAVYEVVSPNGGYVNLREMPDTGSTSLARLYPGERVTVTAMTGAWSKAQYKDEIGYIMTEFLRKAADDAGAEAAEIVVKTVITDEAGRTFESVGAYTAKTVLLMDGKEID